MPNGSLQTQGINKLASAALVFIFIFWSKDSAWDTPAYYKSLFSLSSVTVI